MLRKFNCKKLLGWITLCSTPLLLQGCGNKVDCNGSKVKENAIEIIQSHLNNAAWYKDISFALSGSPELTNTKTLSQNQELKQAECSATYSFNYNGKSREIPVSYYLAYLEDKGEVEVKVAVDSVKAGIMGIAMTERPIKSGDEKTPDSAPANLTNVAVPANDPKIDECVTAKIDIVHKQQGADSPISNDMLTEWTDECKQGNSTH